MEVQVLSPSPDFEGESMQPHQERVVTELNELTEKHAKLGVFLQGATFKSLDVEEHARLTRQHAVMGEYAKILTDRIANFK